MATGKGVIQGDTGVAAVDARQQIIVEAQAHGTGSEHELLVPVVRAMRDVLAPTSLVTADAGYHSEANLQQLATQARCRAAPDPLHDKSGAPTPTSVYQPHDFTYDAAARTCVCPAGHALYRKGRALEPTPGATAPAPGGRVHHAPPEGTRPPTPSSRKPMHHFVGSPTMKSAFPTASTPCR